MGLTPDTMQQGDEKYNFTPINVAIKLHRKIKPYGKTN